jgi:hypothetical protein
VTGLFFLLPTLISDEISLMLFLRLSRIR